MAFRTISVALPFNQSLADTAVQFNRACQMVLDYGSRQKVTRKLFLNNATYKQVRESMPSLPSALVQTARDEASEMLKRYKKRHKGHFGHIVKERLSVRYDNRCFKFYPDSNYVLLTTTAGRMAFDFKHHQLMDRWKGRYTNAQLVIKKHKASLHVQVQIPDFPHIEPKSFLGIDVGIVNTAVCSDNTFYNSKKLRAIKGRYQYLKRKLQHLGTRPAHRKLQKLSGQERRFVLNTNHNIAKAIVSKPFGCFVMEKLTYIRQRGKGRKFSRKLGGWSFAELQRFVEYKAEQLGKSVIYINPFHTSQACSRCGHSERGNRKGSSFKCRKCGFTLHADLNASRNIGVLGKSEHLRLSVNQPIVAPDEPILTGVADGQPQACPEADFPFYIREARSFRGG